MSYAATCSICQALALCRHTFRNGIYEAKSHGGVGCNCPITVTPEHLRAMEIAKATRAETSDEKSAPIQSTLWHKYIVTHRLVEYPTVAHTPEQAINFVRFKLYGARPADSLPPFSCRGADISIKTATDKRTGANNKLTLDAIRARLGRISSS